MTATEFAAIVADMERVADEYAALYPGQSNVWWLSGQQAELIGPMLSEAGMRYAIYEPSDPACGRFPALRRDPANIEISHEGHPPHDALSVSLRHRWVDEVLAR